MAAKPRKPRRRAILPTYATGAEERAAATASGERYVVEVGGERGADGLLLGHSMHFVIRDTVEDATVEHCRSGKTEAHERAAQWNRAGGRPGRTDNISWTKLQRTIPEGSAAWWAERLAGDPETGLELRRRVDTVLWLDDLRELMARTTQDPAQLALLDDRRLLDAVSQHLYRYFGVRRADEKR